MFSHLTKLPITTARERELRRAWRATLLLVVLSAVYALVRIPAGPESVPAVLRSLAPFVIAVLLLVLLTTWLRRAHIEAWKELVLTGFMACPRCGLSLIHAADGGTCTECSHRFQADELRGAWHAVYTRHLRSTRPLIGSGRGASESLPDQRASGAADAATGCEPSKTRAA